MLEELVLNALNDQINAELSAWYSYLGMSAFCSGEQLFGCANWMRIQAAEENTHAMKLYDFLVDRNAPVNLKALSPPKSRFESIVEVFDTALKQEEENTRRINEIFEMALNQKAFASLIELQWFVTEQVEEEKRAHENLTKIKMVADDPAAILEFDRLLSERN